MSDRFENIPDELAQRDQWLYWNASADKPRKPLASPADDYGVAWSDPDEWLSFDEVVTGAEAVDQAGIGYVNAADNDDYARGLYGVIDLDGCVNDDGRPKEWLPSLQPFFDRDAYLEFSPSGEGIHIPVAGIEPPEWWADQHFSAEEHEGVEVLTNKFSTFTGDTLKNSGAEVVDYGEWLDEWLLEAYQAVTGEDPLEEQVGEIDPTDAPDSSVAGQPGDRDEWLTAEVAEEALDHIDPDVSYGTWRDVGMGLADHFGSSTAKSLFKQWSRSGRKWDSEAERQAERIIDDASGYNYTIGTVVKHAKSGGWDASAAAREALTGRPDPTPEPESSAEGEESDGEESDERDESGSSGWAYVRNLYTAHDETDENYKKEARLAAANALEDGTAFMHVVETEKLWVFDDEKGYFVPGGEDHIQQVLECNLGQHYSISEKKEITDRIRARNHTHRDELNAKEADDPLLCVGNGVVNFATGELLEHDPRHKFTRGLEWDYPADGGDPEPVVDFLAGITKREEDWKTLLDHLAHGLMPGHPYRAFVITYGPGGNGKTQMGELFRGFVGGDNAAAVELQDLTGDDDFATGALPSAFINVGDDVGVSEIRNTSILKTVTGGGTLRANEKHEKKFDFNNEAAMFFSANEPPRIAEDKQSIDDRLYPIEMPYRHVDNPDPNDPYEREKVPGISEQLLENEAAMEGLLALVVERGRRLLETNGQYAMPEGPAGRREIYEAASDPIRRFALEFLDEAGAGDVILKDDAYTVYTNLCDRDDERPAREDTFKSKISQQSIVDAESGQTRQLTPGDSRDPCWKYVQFHEGVKTLMPPRLIERYFPGAEADGEADEQADDGEIERERAAFGAEPIRDAAQSLTGYVTVTAEVATTRRLGETESGLKAVLKDASGAIDVVSWERDTIEQLEAAEGECVALQNAEVSEYDGAHQLTTVEGLTSIKQVQQGVGYTEAAPGSDAEESDETVQGGLEEMSQPRTSTDGGEYVQTEPEVLEHLRTKGEASIAELAGQLGESPEAVMSAVESLAESGRITVDGDGPSATVALN